MWRVLGKEEHCTDVMVLGVIMTIEMEQHGGEMRVRKPILLTCCYMAAKKKLRLPRKETRNRNPKGQ